MAFFGNTPGSSFLGGAIGDLAGGFAGLSEANSYSQASKIALENEQLAKTSTELQETALQRQAYQTISSQKAEVAGAGFAAGGSAGDLMRSSVQQASLAKGLTQVQGAIQQQGFAQEAASYQGQAAAAKAKASGGFLGGLLNLAGTVASFL